MNGIPLAEALALTDRTGWLLFPTRGKAPALSGGRGLHDATNDPAGLARLFDLAPDADGFAVNCGASGLAVLDCDVKPGIDGRDSLRDAGLQWLEAETPRALTPRGGEHAFFAGRLPSRTGVLAGVDLKSEGGYVVLPPAPGRLWEAEASPWDVPPAPAPAWLLGLSGPHGGASPRAWLEAAQDFVREGKRNVTAASIAGHLLARKVDPRLAAVLLVAWGRAFCKPPLSDLEIAGIFASISRRENA